MNRKLKVFGMYTFLLGPQARTIAAVTSQKQFAKLIGCSLYDVRGYSSETGNLEELRVAMEHVGRAVVFCPTCETWQVIQPKPEGE
jgi:hypothetical protein